MSNADLEHIALAKDVLLRTWFGRAKETDEILLTDDIPEHLWRAGEMSADIRQLCLLRTPFSCANVSQSGGTKEGRAKRGRTGAEEGGIMRTDLEVVAPEITASAGARDGEGQMGAVGRLVV